MGVTSGLMAKYSRDRVIDTLFQNMVTCQLLLGWLWRDCILCQNWCSMTLLVLFWCFDWPRVENALYVWWQGKSADDRSYHAWCRRFSCCTASGSYYGIFGSIPGIKVVVPATPYDAKGLLLSALEDDNIVIFSEDKTLYGFKGEVPEDYYTVPIGRQLSVVKVMI